MSQGGASRAVCVLNPRSGSGAALKVWPAIAAAFAEAGIAAEARHTDAPGAGTRLAREALAEGHRLIVAVGGDGTIGEVANGFFDDAGAAIAPDAAIGLVPTGTGCDLVRTLGLPADPVAAARRAAGGATRVHDLARLTYTDAEGRPASRFSVNVASLGIGVSVLEKMRPLPGFLPGEARYALGTLAAIPSMRPYALAWAIDDVPQAPLSFFAMAVGTARTFAGGMAILPDAVTDDGLLDACVVLDRPLWEVLPVLPRLYAGTHPGMAPVRTARGARFTLDTDAPLEIDGEIAGRGPVTVTVAAGALRVRV